MHRRLNQSSPRPLAALALIVAVGFGAGCNNGLMVQPRLSAEEAKVGDQVRLGLELDFNHASVSHVKMEVGFPKDIVGPVDGGLRGEGCSLEPTQDQGLTLVYRAAGAPEKGDELCSLAFEVHGAGEGRFTVLSRGFDASGKQVSDSFQSSGPAKVTLVTKAPGAAK